MKRFLTAILSVFLFQALHASEKLLYAVSNKSSDRDHPTFTRVFAVLAEHQMNAVVFSDEQASMKIAAIASNRERFLVTSRNRLFALGNEKIENSDATGIYELFSDASNHYRKITDFQGNPIRGVFFVNPPGTKIGYASADGPQSRIIIHSTETGEVLHRIEVGGHAPGCYPTDAFWLNDDRRLVLRLDPIDAEETSDDVLKNTGYHIVREVGAGWVKPDEGAFAPSGIDGSYREKAGYRFLSELPDFSLLFFGGNPKMHFLYRIGLKPAFQKRIPFDLSSGSESFRVSGAGNRIAYRAIQYDDLSQSDSLWIKELTTGEQKPILPFGGKSLVGWIEDLPDSSSDLDDRAHNGIASRNQPSTGISVVRGTSSPSPKEEPMVCDSPNGRYFAESYPVSRVVRVNELVPVEGNVRMHRMMKKWEMQGHYELHGLSNDGECLVVGNVEKFMLPFGYTREMPVLMFFRQGSLVNTVRLNEVILDFSKLQNPNARYLWAKSAGMNDAGYFLVHTVENRTLMFDMKNSRPVQFKKGQATQKKGWKQYQDNRACFAFQYPSEFRLESEIPKPGNAFFPIFTADPVRLEVEVAILDKMVDSITEKRINLWEKTRISFEDAAIGEYNNHFGAGGPDGGEEGKGPVTRQSFINANSIQCIRFDIKVEEYRFQGEEDEVILKERIDGPFYAFLLSETEEKYRVLFITPKKRGKYSRNEEEFLKQVMESVVLLK